MKTLQEIHGVLNEHIKKYGGTLKYVEFPFVTTLATKDRAIDHMEKLSVLTPQGKRILDNINEDSEVSEVLLKVRKKLHKGKLWKALQIIEEKLREDL